MLILPPGHAQDVTLKRHLSPRERWLVRGVLGVVAALAVALVISLATAGKSSSHGCIYLTIPAATGAQEVYQCGEAARSTCESTSTPGAFSPQAASAILAECHKAHVPVSP